MNSQDSSGFLDVLETANAPAPNTVDLVVPFGHGRMS
jgi:hypothetical protein